MHFNKTPFFVQSIIKRERERKKNNFSPSNIQPLRAVVAQPVQFNSITRPFANRKTVKQSHYTCSTVLEVQNCKSTIQSALVFFLSKYIFKKVNPVIHTHKKHITVLRQHQFQLLFEEELEIKRERTETLGSDWHTGCYNQPILSVTDGK